MKRLILLGGLLLTTCTNRWTAIPQDIPKYERCNPLTSYPQMLKVPEFDQTYIIIDDCSIVDRQRVSIAMHVFLQKWDKVFGKDETRLKAEKALSSILITFNDENKNVNAYSSDGEYGENLPVSGLTLTPGWVWVKMRPGDRLCRSSFAHELIHVVIWTINGKHGDPDHLGAKYLGWTPKHSLVIQDTNRFLCELGI